MGDKPAQYDHIVLPFMATWRPRRSWARELRLSIRLGLLTAAILFANSPKVQADNTWILPPDQAGDWFQSSHWGGSVPTADVNAAITNGGTANVTQSGAACNNLSLANGTIRMTDGSLSETATAYIGNSGSAVFDQSAGNHSVLNYGSLYLGYSSGSSGTYNLEGTAQLSAWKQYLGYSGTGVFTQSGGVNGTTARNGILDLGHNSGSVGTYTMTGGQLSVGTVYIGYWGGTGTFKQSGGTHTVYDGLSIASGAYELSGTGQLSTEAENVYGTFEQSGGTHSTMSIWIGTGGQYKFSSGTLSISGVSLDNNGTFDGCNGAGSLSAEKCIVDFSGGQLKNVASMSVSMGPNSLLIVPAGFDPATAFGAFNSVGLTHTIGTTLTVEAGQKIQGVGGINDLVVCRGNISAGPLIALRGNTINLNNGLVLSTGGSVNLGSGSLTVNDSVSQISGGSLSTAYQYIGSGGTGSFIQSGGYNYAGQLSLGRTWRDTGTYNLSGGQRTGALYVGEAGAGTFVQTGGSNSGSVILGKSSGSSGTYDLNGGTLKVSSLSKGSGTAAFNFGGGTLQASGTLSTTLPMTLTGIGGTAKIDTTNGSATLSGRLSGSGGLNKLGTGTLLLSGDNTYEGPTTVNAGMLKVANVTGSATGSGAVLVDSDATLTGSGSIAGPLSIAGTLSPGNNPGILTVNNEVTFQTGATFDVDIMGLVAGSGYDQLLTTGPVSLAGSLTADFGSFTPTGHDILFVLNNTGLGATTGTFQYADNAKINTFNGYDWYITYDANNAAMPSLNGGNDVAVYSVPEPSCIILLSIGAASLLAWCWRRRKRTA